MFVVTETLKCVECLPLHNSPKSTTHKNQAPAKMTTPMDPTTPATSQSTVSKGKQGDEKRRNWTEDEDIVLLRQVAADLPFLAPYGKILACWHTVAKTLFSSGCLARSIDGKKAQNRFFFLLDEHREYDQNSARKSGVDETTSEKIDLLDDLLAMYDDNKMEQEKKVENKKVESQKKEVYGAAIREAALAGMKKRKSPAAEAKPTSKQSMIDALVLNFEADKETKTQTLAFKRSKLEAEMRERADERAAQAAEKEAERAHQIEMAKIESQKFITMMKMVLDSKDKTT
ncbi:unnamed protein product [Aphanomyces euteiches]